MFLTVQLNLRYTSAMYQPGNAGEVQQSVKEPPKGIIMGSSVQTRTMMHRHRLYLTTRAHNQCREEPMHVIEPRQLQKHSTIKHFDAAPGIRSSVRQNSPPHSVGDTR